MTDPIQQALIAARKNQILDAAAIVFAEKGFHPTTIRDIARQAGIADGTIYNYFENKSMLLLGIFERMRESILAEQTMPAPDEVDTRAFVRAFVQQPLTGLREDNFALFRIVLSEMMVNDELRTRYYEQIMAPTLAIAESYLQAQVDQGRLHIPDVGLTVRAISAMILGLMIEYTLGDSALSAQWDQLPDTLTDLILNGIYNPS
ncbi:MAG: TetR/AcrR family transcriptional regulator [Caldilineaceae bacterium]|nr:TetR/AcrR family transcriptional regulator [Caldilineaceae bacterium]